MEALPGRLIAAFDESRRQLRRDLHQGAQQRLVQTVITLKLARAALGDEDGPAVALVDEALAHAQRATADLRAVVRGLLPVTVERDGLHAGVAALVAELDLPVAVDVTTPRLSPGLEITAFLVVAEALEHAHATRARVLARVADDVLQVEVSHDGPESADVGPALRDRVEASGGRLTIEGTVIRAFLPVF
jgi:signal transduction histidine kinase